ncbi:type II secretion system protein GspG [Candidatus Uabimicrobium sp. HlEnr_7]|uniref:type II secretion system protein GspG n=1 Tax=Candidatus Uabimicrobium helgolandensis TaxID=3095367 RepID=UPI003557AE80
MWKEKISLLLIFLCLVICVLPLLLGEIKMGYHSNRCSAAKTQIKNFGEVLKLYKMKKGFYPLTLEVVTVPNKSGDTFIDVIPKDPWGNDYIYYEKNGKFEIISFGADGAYGGNGKYADIKYSELHKREEE